MQLHRQLEDTAGQTLWTSISLSLSHSLSLSVSGSLSLSTCMHVVCVYVSE